VNSVVRSGMAARAIALLLALFVSRTVELIAA